MKTNSGLYDALKAVLRESKEPLTCVKIYQEFETVREHAETPNRVSDYLGGLWRKGLVFRLPAPRTDADASRWAYEWRRDKKEHKPVAFKEGTALVDKPDIKINDLGRSIVIDMPNFTITIQKK